MKPAPLAVLAAVVVWLAFVPPAEAQTAPAPEIYDAPPVLVSTKGTKPKWATLEQLKQLAVQGDPSACLEFGNRLLEGDGLTQNTPQAIAFLEKAAAAGVPEAQFRLGKIYDDGIGVPVDYPRALDYFIPAARAAVMEAEHNIGAMLVSARGVKRDFTEGLAWLIVAAKAGDSSDAEARVRERMARYPKAIAAAEVRAKEILQDLKHATVVGVPSSDPAPAMVEPGQEKPKAVTTPLSAPPVAAPAIEAPGLPALSPPALPEPSPAPHK